MQLGKLVTGRESGCRCRGLGYAIALANVRTRIGFSGLETITRSLSNFQISQSKQQARLNIFSVKALLAKGLEVSLSP